MLRPLPFSSPDQLVRIYSIKTGIADSFGNPDGPSAPDVRDFAQRSHSFQKMVVYDTWRKNVSFGDLAGEPEQMRVGLVPAAYFEILDVKPLAGRLFTEDENQVGKNFVAAISTSLWKDRFAADPSILGRKIRINGEPYTLVAVMPDLTPERMESGLLDSPKVWTPFAFSNAVVGNFSRRAWLLGARALETWGVDRTGSGRSLGHSRCSSGSASCGSRRQRVHQKTS